MKSPHLLFFYLLTTSFCFFLHNTSCTSPSLILGRRSIKEWSMSPLNHGNAMKKTEVPDGQRQLMTTGQDFNDVKYKSRSNQLEDLVYHIDYHGVTTHPTPTPKHPRP